MPPWPSHPHPAGLLAVPPHSRHSNRRAFARAFPLLVSFPRCPPGSLPHLLQVSAQRLPESQRGPQPSPNLPLLAYVSTVVCHRLATICGNVCRVTSRPQNSTWHTGDAHTLNYPYQAREAFLKKPRPLGAALSATWTARSVGAGPEPGWAPTYNKLSQPGWLDPTLR